MVTAFLNARTWTAADLRADPERVARLLHEFHHRMPAHVSGAARIFWPFHVLRDYARSIAAGSDRLARDLPDHADLTKEFEAAQVPLPIVFGHHDLLPANILESDRLWLIDFEYAGFGTGMFDLAGAASNAGMSVAEGHRLLSAYFGAPPGPALLRAFAAMQCASLLREAMWAMVSELHLAAPGVDYAVYGQETLEKFRLALAVYRQQ
jgi:thiamine kinase-like enzyme